MILSITLNPSVDRTVFVDGLKSFDTNRVVRTETDAGGKGINLSRVARELGAETTAIAFLGGGPGAYVESVLRREDVALISVPVSQDTRLNISIEDGSGQPPTTLNERGPQISPKQIEQLRQICRSNAKGARWACMGGSLPPGLEPNFYAEQVRALKSEGCCVAVDADGDAMKLALEAKPDLIKPNQDEAGRLLGRELNTLQEAALAAQELHDSGIAFAFISMGASGAVLACSEGIFIGVPPQIESKSTIGSGDSLIGGFLAKLCQGESSEEAFAWGIACGAATALTDGCEIGRIKNIVALRPQVQVRRA